MILKLQIDARFSKLLLPFLFLFTPALLHGSDTGLEVHVTSPKLVEVEPDRILSASFLVTNNSSRRIELVESLEIPDGWQLITPLDFPFGLGPGEQEVRVVAYRVPSSFPAGRYRISYNVMERSRFKTSQPPFAQETFTIVVLPQVKVTMIVEKFPEGVIAGEVYRVRIRLANKGNCSTDVRIIADESLDYPVTIVPSELKLEAESSKIVTCEVQTSSDINEVVTSLLQVRAETGEAVSDKTSLSQAVTVDLIPKVTGDADPYHRIPTEFTFLGVGEEGEKAYQIGFSGSGSLDESGKRKIDFSFQGPDMQYKSTFLGRRDEMWIRYHDDNLELYTGDRTYSLSPLTEKYRYGRGAQVRFTPGRLGISAMYIEDRWSVLDQREAGGSISYRLSDWSSLKSNFLYRMSDSQARLYSVQARLKRGKTFNLEVETGLNSGENGDVGDRSAFRVETDGEIRKGVHFTAESQRAGSDYSGYYTDEAHNTGSVSFPLVGRIRGSFSFLDAKNNLNDDLEKGASNRERRYRGGFNCPFPYNTGVSLEYEDVERKDRLMPVDYDYAERFLRLGIGKTFLGVNLQSYMERGFFEDRLIETKDNSFARYSLYANVSPDHIQSYSFFTRIGREHVSGDLQNANNLGVSGDWRIGKRLLVGLSYQMNHTGSGTIRESDQILYKLSYTFPGGHSLIARGRWLSNNQQNEGKTAFYVGYTVPWRMPASRKESVGDIHGRIRDAGLPGKPPLQNVIFRIGDLRAVSDRHGKFVFPSLDPGVYYVQVDNNTLGGDRIVDAPIPLSVIVKGGETSSIEIYAVAPAMVNGTVFVLQTPGDNRKSDFRLNPSIAGAGMRDTATELHSPKSGVTKGRPNMLVELTDGRHCFRELTDGKGRFSFKNLIPGDYMVRVFEDDLPAFHYFEQREFSVHVDSGESEVVRVRILPRKRAVRIIDEGELTRRRSPDDPQPNPDVGGVRE